MGPYQINYVDYYIPLISPGVYILSRNGNTAAYVGRSDSNLSARLKQSSKEGYSYPFFWFEYTDSARDAYFKECEYYHRYNPQDNINHPAAPFGTNWKCSMMGCPFS